MSKTIQLSEFILLITVCWLIVQESSLAGGLPTSDALSGVTWTWQQTRYNNDTRAIPADPSHYTIIFNPDGTINIRADCNRGGGTYLIQDQQITIEVTHTTRAMCPPESLEQTFIKDLHAAAIYFFKDGNLYLDLKYDTGTMAFHR